MMLWEEFLTECNLQEKTITPDGQGGSITSVSDKTDFKAAIVKNTTNEGTFAEKSIPTAMYTVTFIPNIEINYRDIIRRKSDNKFFTITSDYLDSRPPGVSTFDFAQVNAEEWEP